MNLNLPIEPKEYPAVRAEMWYDRSVKSWVVQKRTAEAIRWGIAFTFILNGKHCILKSFVKTN